MIQQVMRANSSVPCPAMASASLRGYIEVSSRFGMLRSASVSGFFWWGCCGHLSRDTSHMSPLLHFHRMASASCRCHMTTPCGCGMLRLARRRRLSVLLQFRQVRSTSCLDLDPSTQCTSHDLEHPIRFPLHPGHALVDIAALLDEITAPTQDTLEDSAIWVVLDRRTGFSFGSRQTTIPCGTLWGCGGLSQHSTLHSISAIWPTDYRGSLVMEGAFMFDMLRNEYKLRCKAP
ncbi:hypothetical protein DFJ58DRAFT_367164 [Suillus subalutaceus]|uniref:uncharacterized protein n=1 Tax=Suillus subalutaceus TaxID=48586 RepID=UPI001B86CE49|nr:uncharacterized protein DFJ58DRAFT_367164 [Suillus subalutaceus]KAG1873660.1 hypothetical protein DFJ58DRAFT_367164 [Suillus subalutaceus]